MSAGNLRQDHRPARAAQIVAAGDIRATGTGAYRVRDIAGSGTWHTTSATSCTCQDFRRTGLQCKHQIALANWSSRTDELPGNFLDTDLNFDDVALTAPRGVWYKGTYYTAEQLAAAEQARNAKAAGPVCPTCGSATTVEFYYIGGRGMVGFHCCLRTPEHQAVRV